MNISTRQIAVIVDGNSAEWRAATSLAVRTVITNNIVTIEKCRDIISKIESATGYKAKRIRLLLSVYENEDVSDVEGPCRCLLNKDVFYNATIDEMVIWQDGAPIYSRCGDVICRDDAALADCLL